MRKSAVVASVLLLGTALFPVAASADSGWAQRGGIIFELLRLAKEVGDEGRRIGCFQRRSGWRVLEPPSLQEWACWVQMR